MALTRRKTAPKPKKEAPEPTTFTEAGPVNVAVQEESFIGKCVECSYYQANSRFDNLCLDCHKKAAGFVFDEKQNKYVKKGKK